MQRNRNNTAERGNIEKKLVKMAGSRTKNGKQPNPSSSDEMGAKRMKMKKRQTQKELVNYHSRRPECDGNVMEGSRKNFWRQDDEAKLCCPMC